MSGGTNMIKISKIGAAALAAALSVTLITPLSARAEVISTWEEDAEGIRYYTYKNEDTGDSLSEKDYNRPFDRDGIKKKVLASELKVLTISTNSYNETAEFYTTNDVKRFENFKSNKDGLEIKFLEKIEDRDDEGKDYLMPDYISKDGNTYYYKNVYGKIVAVDKAKADTDMPKGKDTAAYKLRFYTKKAGTYKVSYDAIMKNGSKVKKTFKVIAKADGGAYKTITYAGKTVWAYGGTDSVPANYMWEKGFGPRTTRKESGVLKVSMNKGFKLKKLEVGEISVAYQKFSSEDEKTYEMGMYNNHTDAKSSLDEVKGIPILWKKVKNGKKIKLSTVDDIYASTEQTYKHSQNFGMKSTTTTTYIRVTYYDTKNKVTRRDVTTIRLVQK